MASSVGSTVDTVELRITYTDEADETYVQTIVFDGTVTNTEIGNYIDALEALTNASISAKVVKSYPVEGIANTGKPAAALQSLLASILALEFQATNPINADKTISKQILIPAYVNSLRNDGVKPHVPVTNSTPLNALIAIAALNLDYVAGDGDHYTPTWTYNPASKFGTKPTITDGF